MNQQVKLDDVVQTYYGISLHEGSCRCPFHDDSRKSAKVHGDNSLYCFAESKTYRPYDVLKLVGMTDEQLLQRFGNLIPEARPVSNDCPSMEKYFDIRNQLRMKPFDLTSLLSAWKQLFDNK